MTYYFYDLETSSGSPRNGRIMQFAGQRTDEDLKPIGNPDDILIKLADDVIPEPEAILIHKITPQKTLETGITEQQFVKYFQDKIAINDTVFIGFNNIRFDDEFTRRICYRNFHDPYQWHWKDGKSRWDILDPIRMMRALRPEGLKWPMLDGKPTVKLELMAKENGLLHTNAHDALSDVEALIDLTQKFKNSQPKLFEYLLKMRDKKTVSELVLSDNPFIYTSGKYKNEYEKTTIVHTLFKHPRRESVVVFDLREDPTVWFKKTPEELAKHWQARFNDKIEQLPVKLLQFNRCPAVAPISVLDNASIKRIDINLDSIRKVHKLLAEHPDFIYKVQQALDIIEDEQQTRLALNDTVDEQIYDGFWSEQDQKELFKVRSTEPDNLSTLLTTIVNQRIRELLPLYKARNFPKFLTIEERAGWEEHKRKLLLTGNENSKLAKFTTKMQDIIKNRQLSKEDKYLLTELQLYVESIIPEPDI